MLIALAITTMVGISISSVVMVIAANSKRDLTQTDQYEGLRLVAHRLAEDARFAYHAVGDFENASLTLYEDDSLSNYVKYTFATYDGSPSGQADVEHLHRWDVKGGAVTDDIVATGLVIPTLFAEDATEFLASSGTYSRHIEATLVKERMPGQERPVRIKVIAHLR